MAISEAKKKADEKWRKANYTQVKISMPKEEAQKLKDYCQEKGISVASFLKELIKKEIENP